MENKTETRVFKCKCCGSFNEIKYRSDETQIRQLPEGLESFLMDLTVSLLKQNPSDLSQMTHLAYKYFSCKAKNLTGSYDSENKAFLSNFNESQASAIHTLEYDNSSKEVPEEENDEEENNLDEDKDELNELQTNQKSSLIRPCLRRISVFSKTFDPEDDEKDTKNEDGLNLTNQANSDSEDFEIVQNKFYEDFYSIKNQAQKKKLTLIISSIIIFKHLYEDDIKELVESMFERKCTSDEEIIREGDNGHYFYVIVSGTYEAFIKNMKIVKENIEFNENYGYKVREYKDAGYFGELALLYDQPRQATIVVREEGVLYCMNQDKFKRLVIGNAFKRRKMYEEFLQSVPLLKSSMNDYERSQVADALKRKTFKDGDIVFRQNDRDANGMYFIESGKVKIVRNLNGTDTTLKILGVGEYFGELALVNKAPRSASAYIFNNDDSILCKLAFLDLDAFERLMGPCIELIKSNMSVYSTLDSI